MARNARVRLSQKALDMFAEQDSGDSLKFDLYVKSREIKQIVSSLQNVALLPAEKRQTWVDDHESMIVELMDSFMDDSILAMDGLQLDEEGMNLSVELVSNMRDAMNIINSIFSDHKQPLS